MYYFWSKLMKLVIHMESYIPIKKKSIVEHLLFKSLVSLQTSIQNLLDIKDHVY